MPTFVLLALPTFSHIFRKCMLCCVSIFFFHFFLIAFSFAFYIPIDIHIYVDHCWFWTQKSIWRVNEKKLKPSEALQSFSGWYIVFYIDVDQGCCSHKRQKLKCIVRHVVASNSTERTWTKINPHLLRKVIFTVCNDAERWIL